MDILDRKSAPLNDGEWSRMDETVVSTACRMLVGRKVIEVLGPLGSGVYSIPYSLFSGKSPTGTIWLGSRMILLWSLLRALPLIYPMLYKDFKNHVAGCRSRSSFGFTS